MEYLKGEFSNQFLSNLKVFYENSRISSKKFKDFGKNSRSFTKISSQRKIHFPVFPAYIVRNDKPALINTSITLTCPSAEASISAV